MRNFRNIGVLAGLALSVSVSALSAYAEPTECAAGSAAVSGRRQDQICAAEIRSRNSRRCLNITSRIGSRRISSIPASCRRSRTACPRSRWSSRPTTWSDGVGVYGDTLRHVIGGRPEGWNYGAGQTQGWGGIDIGLSECLTRTAPLFQVKAKDTSSRCRTLPRAGTGRKTATS
jgi:peptide/nickel transport system substrate-binding protein